MAKTSGLIDPIEQATEAVRVVQQTHYTEAQLPDIVGRLKVLERFLASTRKNLEAEVGPGTPAGDNYQTSTARKCHRSYNTNGLLTAIRNGMDTEAVDPVMLSEAIVHAMNADALRIQWQWTNLQKLVDELDVTLTIAKHEISDGDPQALIGEVWESRTSVVAKPEPEVV